ncbi:hypothetical protein KAT92_04045 [Candidatus Babeliales bacterium]|nr:hypothetical protein [Candidatus Babeliales bacterium]
MKIHRIKISSVIFLLFSCATFFSSAQDRPKLTEELVAQMRVAKTGLKNVDEQMLNFLSTSYPEESKSFFVYWADLLQVDLKQEKEIITSILQCLDVETSESNKTLFFLTMSEVFELGIRNRLDEKDTKEVGRVLSENVLLRFEQASKKADDATRSIVPVETNALGLSKRQVAGLWVGGIAFTGFLCFIMWKAAMKDSVSFKNVNKNNVYGNKLDNNLKLQQETKAQAGVDERPGFWQSLFNGAFWKFVI